MAQDKDTCSSDISWILYSTVLYFLIFFVGSLPHGLLRKPQIANHPKEIDLDPFTNARDSQASLSPELSFTPPAVEKSNTGPSTQQQSSSQPSFGRAIACQILHVYLVMLQYQYCNMLVLCHMDDPIQPAVAFWRGLALLCAGVSMLYSLSAFLVDKGSARAAQPS